MPEAMGGYFELELPRGRALFPHAHAFNSARSAFQALLLARQVRRVHLPHYLCAVMHEAARSINVEVIAYGLNRDLELVQLPVLDADDALLAVDHFGLKTAYIRDTLAARYGEALIVDNSQALFSPPIDGVATLYSPRKFVGVPDGGWLVHGPAQIEQMTVGVSAGRCSALLGRLADGAEAHYADFQHIEEALGAEGRTGMSRVTTRLLDSIDYNAVKQQRQANFSQLHDALAAINLFSPVSAQPNAALCYPLLMADARSAHALRAALLQERVFVPCYWREVLESPTAPALERDLVARLLPLPIDQRNNPDDIARLAAIVLQHVAQHPPESSE